MNDVVECLREFDAGGLHPNHNVVVARVDVIYVVRIYPQLLDAKGMWWLVALFGYGRRRSDRTVAVLLFELALVQVGFEPMVLAETVQQAVILDRADVQAHFVAIEALVVDEVFRV
ncbi:hypothetical protein H257_07141 [Aphanomyces astaci]|uniref:Uncharacterized protein n=1 Tax=Aphanomyces astaci TaxID=112090 RepID=W4GJS3_APHAT|nr:hypothetical protein H257_07141 [Aphanomyces astaci]ETV79942.1 hypothetical protein H257_07141 [Aphanomyces astaci]|eukprot:XP_009830878.1 hypothetical protein H257_07141 [Aphanomyces astaci]